MLDDLKTLIELIGKLPNYMIWVLVGFLLYKLSVIGSIYGVIRLLINRVCETIQARRAVKEVDIRGVIDGMCITSSGAHVSLLAQVSRVVVHKERIYFDSNCAVWLSAAIEAAIVKDKEAAIVKDKEAEIARRL